MEKLAISLWKKFSFEKKFLQNKGNLKQINSKGNVKELLKNKRNLTEVYEILNLHVDTYVTRIVTD